MPSISEQPAMYGERLRADRVAAGLTQEELAERSGLSSRAIGDLERGVTRRPRRETARRIAEAFGQARASRHAPASAERLAVPAQLPASVSHFLGREAELAGLARLVSTDDRSSAVPIAVITGMAGVGKTALAVRWAHQMAGEFPDGQLYVNLRGYDSGQPMTSADALTGFLRALGAEERDIHQDTAQRAALYRSLLARRRVLVLLDNANSPEQIRPLLPGAPGCAVLVTSRDSLAGLVAVDGGRRLELGLLSLGDATLLLRTLIGERADSDPRAAMALAAHCARLPLALRLTAELVLTRETEPLQALARELAGSYGRLDLMDAGGDPRAAMRAAFSWSLQYLDSVTARVFRMLGLHPAGEFESDGVAAMAALTAQDAAAKLTALARAHLIYSTRPGRYGIHDLLRVFAAEQAHEHETPAARRGARTRLFDYYLAAATAAVDTLFPASRRQATARATASASAIAAVGDPERAREWLDARRATMVEIITYTANHGWPEQCGQLASVLFRYLESGGYYSEIVSVYTDVGRAASSVGNRATQAEALNNLCVVDLRQGRYHEAATRLEHSLELYLQIGDIHGQARALGNLGIVEFEVGSYQQAAARQERALALYRQTGDQAGAARTVDNLGLVYLYQCRHDEAVSQFRQALELARQLGMRRLEANALSNLGLARCRQGQHQEAIRHSVRALALLRQLSDPYGQAGALNNMGEALLGAGEPERAMAQHTAALALAGEISYKSELARSHADLGRACEACARPGEARRHWRHAAALYGELGAPQEAEVRALLLGACPA